MEIKPRLAAIDVGTNSFHLIIVEVEPSTGKFSILTREKEIVRLGSGSSDMKYLTEDAVRKALITLKRFKALADSSNAPLRAVATSAVREAKNQLDFISRVYDEIGITIEVASGVEEARYIYLGVLQALPVYDKKILLIDIGGGSTEFLVGYRREIAFDSSLKLGSIRLTQRFFPDGRTNPRSVKECRQYIRGYMQPIVRDLSNYSYELTIGSSGTIMNLSNIINGKSSKGDSTYFTKDELSDTVNKIIEAETPKSRTKIPGLDPARADIIAAGALLLDEIFRSLKLKEMKVSEFALREGVIFDTIEKLYMPHAHKGLSDIRYKSVMHVAENFRFEREHSLQVCKLALKIFDATRKIHKLGDTEREYLEAAAILHEVGLYVAHSQHHRHSYYLIRNSEMLGFNENEKEIIANVARYHRKSHPKSKHPDFIKLSPNDQKIIRKLSAILRIADGLDRSHTSVVCDIEASITDDKVIFIISTKDNVYPELELWGAENKKSLFEEVYNIKAEFLFRDR
jgi:exopolyphosphatase/guanosine-5'-triphosphate,3'-diphosphate pyrophosphatase